MGSPQPAAFWWGVETARRLKAGSHRLPMQETAIGALGLYVSNQTVAVFQPMNINFGIIPPLDHRVKGKRNKNAELSQRSLPSSKPGRRRSVMKLIIDAMGGDNAPVWKSCGRVPIRSEELGVQVTLTGDRGDRHF